LPYDTKLAKYGENVDRAKNQKNQAQLNIKRDNWRKNMHEDYEPCEFWKEMVTRQIENFFFVLIIDLFAYI
jgi:hypothetical protein